MTYEYSISPISQHEHVKYGESTNIIYIMSSNTESPLNTTNYKAKPKYSTHNTAVTLPNILISPDVYYNHTERLYLRFWEEVKG